MHVACMYARTHTHTHTYTHTHTHTHTYTHTHTHTHTYTHTHTHTRLGDTNFYIFIFDIIRIITKICQKNPTLFIFDFQYVSLFL